MDGGLGTILDAHGGLGYWRSLATVELEMSASGFLFTGKHVPRQRHVRLTIHTDKTDVTLHDYPSPGQSAVLQGNASVEIRDSSGAVLASRIHPRESFGFGRRTLYWDAMDFAYFLGYAMWNYTTLPFLLTYPGFSVTKSALPGGGAKLSVAFPPDLPTHCTAQTLYLDPSGRLTRHDYTAEVVGSWASAVHLCGDYHQFGGLWMPTRRRVYPKGPFNRALTMPTLVALDIHDARPSSA